MLDRQITLDIARLLDEVVVSGDRIGTALADAPPDEFNKECGAYLQEIDFWRRASSLRSALFESLWPDAPVEDDDRIEAELAPRYWHRPS